jgi:ergothioneine biosynthesis protein EgtB
MSLSRTETELRNSLTVRLAEARVRTDEMLHLVRPEALYDHPIPEWHQPVFYLGHFEAFDWNLIGREALGLEPFSPKLDELFRFGVLPSTVKPKVYPPSEWPRVEEIQRYNRQARTKVDECLRTVSLRQPPHPYLQDGYAFQLAIEHRWMHVETMAYVLHALPYDRKAPRPSAREVSAPPVERRLIDIPAGSATLGLKRGDRATLGWDNEYELHTVEVPAFAIESHNVTNGDFLEFVRAGGYRERSLWSEDDWAWQHARGIEHPLYWRRRGDQWRCRALFEEILLPLSWPVYVSHAEASAYARWAGKALPTEAQFHRAAYGTPDGCERAYPWGNEAPSAQHGNFDCQRWDPAPVGTHPAGTSAFGVADLVGNGWEWTSTAFHAFPGFEPLPFYPTFSANFFDGKHYVVKGGSARTAACLLRRSFRNWFQPHFPYVYASFRCVEN